MIPEFLYSYGNDIIYHYTKTTIAIENILFKKELRFSPRKKSNDPIENLPLKIYDFSSASSNDQMEKLEKETDLIVENIREKTELKFSKIRQLCFCSNDIKNDQKLFQSTLERFGFMKPRMWDQYGDNYKGACLALSKNELVKNKKIAFKGYTKYLGYDKLKLKEKEINRNLLAKDNKYEKQLLKYWDTYLFLKHSNYRDEKEYRLCTLCDEEYDYIDIEKCIKGIFVSPELIGEFSREQLKKILPI